MKTDRNLLIDDAFASQFLRGVSQRLTSTELERWQGDQVSIQPDASRIAEENGRLAEDPGAARWIQLSSMLLATYRSLRSSLGDEERALTILREALTRPLQEQITSYMQARFGISQDAPEEAFHQVSKNFKSRGEVSFGPSFRYVDDVRDDRRAFVNIERCLFNEFLRRNGALEVTTLDNVWADELSKPKYGVRFDGPLGSTKRRETWRQRTMPRSPSRKPGHSTSSAMAFPRTKPTRSAG